MTGVLIDPDLTYDQSQLRTVRQQPKPECYGRVADPERPPAHALAPYDEGIPAELVEHAASTGSA